MHFISRRMSSEPDWKGMWKNWHILGSSAHARTRRSVKYLGRPDTDSQAASFRAFIKLMRNQGVDRHGMINIKEPSTDAGYHRWIIDSHGKGVRG